MCRVGLLTLGTTNHQSSPHLFLHPVEVSLYPHRHDGPGAFSHEKELTAIDQAELENRGWLTAPTSADQVQDLTAGPKRRSPTANSAGPMRCIGSTGQQVLENHLQRTVTAALLERHPTTICRHGETCNFVDSLPQLANNHLAARLRGNSPDSHQLLPAPLVPTIQGNDNVPRAKDGTLEILNEVA